MKTNLKILFGGMFLVLLGIFLKLNKINIIDTILIIAGLLLEAYALFQIVKMFFLRSKNASKD
jgi:hypothetical protein